MTDELEAATKWLMLFGTREVPSWEFHKIISEHMPGGTRFVVRRPYIEYYSCTSRPDYYQLTQEGLDLIARGE